MLNPELNKVQRTATLQMEPDGSLKGTVMVKRFGDLSVESRKLYSQGDVKQQKSYLDHVLSEDFVSFAVSDFKVENVQLLNKDLTTSFSLSAEKYGRPMGSLLMVRPRVLGSEGIPIDRKVR